MAAVGCGTSVTVAPFNGKTILEINYQYMADLQGDAGAQLSGFETCNCCRSRLLLPRLVWGSGSFGWEGIFLPVSK